MKAKGQELEARYKLYQALPANTPEAIKKDKESELVYLQESIQKFQQEAQASMQKKHSDLVAPVFEKVGKAIEEVAVKMVFRTSLIRKWLGVQMCSCIPTSDINISNLVLKKLGVPVPNSGRGQ